MRHGYVRVQSRMRRLPRRPKKYRRRMEPKGSLDARPPICRQGPARLAEPVWQFRQNPPRKNQEKDFFLSRTKINVCEEKAYYLHTHHFKPSVNCDESLNSRHATKY